MFYIEIPITIEINDASISSLGVTESRYYILALFHRRVIHGHSTFTSDSRSLKFAEAAARAFSTLRTLGLSER